MRMQSNCEMQAKDVYEPKKGLEHQRSLAHIDSWPKPAAAAHEAAPIVKEWEENCPCFYPAKATADLNTTLN